MKKISLIILSLLLLIPITTFAAGGISVSPSSITMNVGETKSFKIIANNAVGRVDIQPSGSIKVNSTSHWLENNSVTINVTGNAPGTHKVLVKISDAATFDEEELNGTKTINVKVVEKNNSNNSTNKTTTKKVTTTNNLSKNTKLETLEIKGHELTKKDGEYFLTIDNNIEKITINAIAEDKLSKISGIGEKELKVGTNKFEIVVTSESGKKETYKVNVTRKDGFVLEDLDKVLNLDNTTIILKEDTVLTKDQINKIKSSKKEIVLDYNSEEISYSWIIDGSKIKDGIELNTNINFTSNNKDKILEKANYADGIVLNFKHSGKTPKGTKVKVYVGNKFKNEEKINLYYNGEKELDLINKKLEVKDGFVEFDLEHCSEYYLTKALLNTNNINIFLITSIIEFLIILGLSFLYIKKLKK